jgi:hypothetical protein
MAYSFRYLAGSPTVYPVVGPFQPKPIRRRKAAQAKELVDNSQLNDTIIAHIDSAVGAPRKFLSSRHQRPQKVMLSPACIGVKVLK